MSPLAALQFFLRTAVFLCLAGLARVALAGSGEDWTARVWQMDDGLPAANVTGIGQTPDGFMWLATQSGLARFDGLRFEIVKIPVGREQPIIRAMLCDAGKNFWLAEAGGALVHFGGGYAKLFGGPDGLPNTLALQMVEAGDHTLWVAYDDGSVFRITPKNEVIRAGVSEGLNSDGVCSLALDVHGTLWYAKGMQFGYWQSGRFWKVGDLEDRNPQILGAHDGSLWICTSTKVWKLNNTNKLEVAIDFTGTAGRIRPSVLFEDFNGHLWIGTSSEGLFQLDHTNLIKVVTSQNKIHAIFRDQEGSIWVGTDGGGLNRIFPKAVELRGRDEGLPFETVRSMAEDRNGDLCVVTQDGALTRLPGDDWNGGQPVANWPGGIAHSVLADKKGVMWIGTYRRGLLRWENGNFSRLTTAEGLAGSTIRSLMVDSRNDLWIGLENEVVQRLHEGRFQTFKEPPKCRAIRAMTEDASGNVWFGTLGGELLRAKGDQLVEVPPSPGEERHPIRCLTATPDGSIWIGHAVYGVSRVKDGKFKHIGRDEGLFDGNICAMMPDPDGRMWFASDRGIFYVTLSQLNNYAEGKTAHVQSIFYGRDAGLPGLQAYYGYWPGALNTQSGQILFPTHSGIAVIYPDHVRSNGKAPNVFIQSIAVDGREIPTATNAVLKLPPDNRKIEISFTAPSFIAPEQVRFRYRLAGWSDDWSDVERGRSMSFQRLPPGDYTFQVAACNNHGVWSEYNASLAFTVTPYFWQSWPFRFLLAMIFLVLTIGLARHFFLRRVRLLLKRVEQEAALQKERTRIAQDMHDELGARFTQISLLGELSSKALAEPGKASEFLNQIGRASQAGVKSLDEIVWAVNPSHDTLVDLLDYTGQFARDFLAAAGIECRLDFPDPMPAGNVSGEIRHSIFLIVKETLNNVVKHAQASRVRIGFETTASHTMRWLIEDNGQGFVSGPEKALADGLRNIRQRSATLGGHASIDSVPSKGTRVTVEIPLPA
jgi:ligand-binding sensor domain-containing protein/signal transduction histidine kinase